jgi:NAD(P)-dependent dehydrogenase (short-subunit alcohol dehydrogenase family)
MTSQEQHITIVLGASRGIGRQIAITLSQTPNSVIIVAAKSTSPSSAPADVPPDPNSAASTIDTVVQEIVTAGGHAFARAVDVRSSTSVSQLVSWTLQEFGRIDSVVYNPGAIFWASVVETPIERYELMHKVNSLGLYALIQSVLPHYYSRGRGDIVIVSPPIYARFTRGKTAYAMTKFAMTTLMIGLNYDFARLRKEGFMGKVCCIWPATGVLSAATEYVSPGKHSALRKATIFADAVKAILESHWTEVSGVANLDEEFLRKLKGLKDFSSYAVVQGTQPRRIMPAKFPDLRVEEEDDEGDRVNSLEIRKKKAAKL